VVIAVNGTAYDGDVLEERQGGATGKAPIELLVKEFDRYRTVKIDYHGGLRHPHPERIRTSGLPHADPVRTLSDARCERGRLDDRVRSFAL
jgi:hypothetical protein